MIRPTLAAALLLAAAPALAKPAHTKEAPAPWAGPYAGTWTLSPSTEGGYACTLKLGTDMAIGGAGVEVSATCRKNHDLEDVAAWTLTKTGDIELIDPLRKPVLKFRKSRAGDYMAEVKGADALVLSRGDLAGKSSPHEIMSGTFSLSGPDNADACGFTVTSDKAGTSGTLKRVGTCAAKWKAKAWAKWSVKGDQITLSDKAGKALLKLKRGDRTTFVVDYKSGAVFFGPGAVSGG